MALLRERDIEGILACPRCRSGLDRTEKGYECGCGFVATRVGRWPVLVDFEASILDEHEIAGRAGGSAVPRSRMSGLRRVVHAVTRRRRRPPSPNVDRMLQLLPDQAVVVVVGGGADEHGLDHLYAHPTIDVIGFDVYGSDLVQFIADGHSIPLVAGSVDAVIAQAVLEHVLDPAQVVGEIHRILRPGGVVYAETAFMQQVHEGPYDFTRYTESGHRWLFRNFELVDAGALTGPGTQLAWTVDYLLRGLTRSQPVGRIAHRIVAPLSCLDRLVPPAYSVDNSPAVYFLGRRSESSLLPRDMAAYYQGAQR
jgi:hypothetical protein